VGPQDRIEYLLPLGPDESAAARALTAAVAEALVRFAERDVALAEAAAWGDAFPVKLPGWDSTRELHLRFLAAYVVEAFDPAEAVSARALGRWAGLAMQTGWASQTRKQLWYEAVQQRRSKMAKAEYVATQLRQQLAAVWHHLA
jgi:hypothetical protein